MRYSLPLVLCQLAIAGCGGGGVTFVQPPPPPTTDVVLAAVPHPEDAATAAALGWQTGIPAMTGTITPLDSSRAPQPFTAGADGRVTFPGLSAGDYIIEAWRWLSAEEQSDLRPGDDAVGFAGRWRQRVSASEAELRLETPASRRKGLVISEWAFNPHGYDSGGFLELFNNADTTVYLDGMIVAEGYHFSRETDIIPCTVSAPFRDDPLGIWSRSFQRFPGSGREYPVAPGRTIVVATDAIDHRPFEATGLDLSRADFEFSGAADVDNPAAPNLIEVGLTVYPAGHGLQFAGAVHVPFITTSIDLGAMTSMSGPGGTSRWTRFPADHILDAFAIGSVSTSPPDCPRLLNIAFDRAHSRVRSADEVQEFERSVSRRRIPVQDGRVRLQWTRSGNADFVRTTRTPGLPGPHRRLGAA